MAREREPCGPEQSFLGGGRASLCNTYIIVTGTVAAFCNEEGLPMSSNVTHLQTPLPQIIEKHCQDGQGLESSG